MSICSTHEGGMSKLLSSFSLPCRERRGRWVGLEAEVLAKTLSLSPTTAKPGWSLSFPGEPEAKMQKLRRTQPWAQSPPCTCLA